MDLRKMTSIAKAELDRLRENRKLTKKGRKNKRLLLEECRAISSAELVNYMEKKKSQLRMLERNYIKQKKQGEERSLNRQFKRDPRSVYARFGILYKGEEDRPKFVRVNDNGDNGDNTFENVFQACSFWMDLWEKNGTGNEDVKWLRPIRKAIAKKVPPPSDESWGLHTTQAVTILSKKRNWSAPSQDKLVNYWWKRAQVLHVGVAKAFVCISESTEDYPAWFSEGKTRFTEVWRIHKCKPVSYYVFK